ncbi:MAG: helix-turn-helix transcriptional regulator [Spirochaetia bacterium]|nr:helix-turn-helix transcriptional regulator [Spirochaetia bacterium]
MVGWSAYNLSADRRFEHFFIHFTLEIAPGVDLFRDLHKPESRQAPSSLRKKQWKKEFYGNRIDGWMRCASQLQALISSFARLEGAALVEIIHLSGKYAALFEAIQREPFVKLRLPYLAAQARQPLRTLRHAFQKDFKISLPEFVRRNFIGRAQELLVGSGAKIREISAKLGFRDEYHFSRLFHRFTGLSPQRFRTIHHGN